MTTFHVKRCFCLASQPPPLIPLRLLLFSPHLAFSPPASAEALKVFSRGLPRQCLFYPLGSELRHQEPVDDAVTNICTGHPTSILIPPHLFSAPPPLHPLLLSVRIPPPYSLIPPLALPPVAPLLLPLFPFSTSVPFSSFSHVGLFAFISLEFGTRLAEAAVFSYPLSVRYSLGCISFFFLKGMTVHEVPTLNSPNCTPLQRLDATPTSSSDTQESTLGHSILWPQY